MSGLGLTFLRRGNLAHPIAGSDYILSETRGDAEVFRILMSKGVSSDGVGITREDAEKVTSIGTWFKGNTTITSFNELIYFTSVTKLDNGAFQGCTALQSIDLGNISSIGSNAFYQSGLVDVRSVGAITTTGSQAFQECTSLAFFPFSTSITSVPYRSFYRCRSLVGDVYIPNATTIGNGSFSESAIRSLNAPKATIIEGAACSSCTQLENINIIGATQIKDQTFNDCTSLKYVELGENLTSLGWRAFNGCSALEYVICRAITPPTINAQVFATSCPIYVPDASVDAYKAASNWSGYASRIKPLSEYQG